MAWDSVAGLPAPAAHSRRAAEGTASSGFMMSAGPGWPNAVMPHSAQVDGRNCIGPRAPALDGASLAPSPLSISLIAASTVHDRPGQYSSADALYNVRRLFGTPVVGTFVVTGSLLTVTTGTRLITLAPAPMSDRTFAISVTRFTPGALISTAKFFASPSWADRAWSTIASAPGTLNGVCAPNVTCAWTAAET